MTVGVVSLGCSKNRVDTELMLGILTQAGYEITGDEARAEILIVNTCGFIESAKQESIDTILALAEYKQTGRLKLLVVTGCLAQRYEKSLLEEMPEIDLLLGVSQYPALPGAIERALRGERASYCQTSEVVLSGERVLTTVPYTAYVRIADGCDNCCAYCAIPLIRGRFRSRSMSGVLEEIRTLAGQGVKEHILVAQDTSRFGVDIAGHSLLPELMVQAAEIPGVEWLRVLYCYPDQVDERLLEAMALKPNICKYLDLPLQHADPEILRRMNRRGDMKDIKRLLLKARDMGFTLRTTFITGFPGETPKQFETLMDFAQEVRFDRMGTFAYSAEEDTLAAEMPDQVPEEIRTKRMERLMLLQQEISLERNRLRVGTTERMLVEVLRDDGTAVGRSAAEAPEIDGLILTKPLANLVNKGVAGSMATGIEGVEIGEFVNVRITDAEPYDLWGVIE